MKRNILLSTLVLLTGSLIAADSSPKDDVTAAAKALAAKSNYSWKMTIDNGPNAQFTPGPTEGKTDKDGTTWLSATFQDNTTEGIAKGGKVVVKTDAGWEVPDTAAGGGGGGGNPGAFMGRRLQNLKVPAAEVEDLVSKTKEIKKDGDAFSGDFTEDGAKAVLATGFGRRGGSQANVSNAKGSVKFWVKDGLVTKYQTKVTGKRTNQNGDEVEVDRTVTVEVKDVGTTKLEIPAEAKAKLS